jgi:hypothetical protein
MMRISDLTLLAKKIGVGILVTLIPLAILTSGLFVGQKLLKRAPHTSASHSMEASNAH